MESGLFLWRLDDIVIFELMFQGHWGLGIGHKKGLWNIFLKLIFIFYENKDLDWFKEKGLHYSHFFFLFQTFFYHHVFCFFSFILFLVFIRATGNEILNLEFFMLLCPLFLHLRKTWHHLRSVHSPLGELQTVGVLHAEEGFFLTD